MTASAEILQAARLLWDFHRVYDELEPADAIVGLGSYDLRVAERCADLYKAGLSSRVIFTGASGNWTKGLFDSSEAAAFGRHAIECGVPSEAITLEETATNIGENLASASRLIPEAKSFILVTKPQTQLRCKATAQKQWPGVRAMTTTPQTAFENQPTGTQDERGLFCEMVGDLERIMTYPARGFQVGIDVPNRVLSAFRTLRSAGFTDHLPGAT
ncbi:MAG: YdcF family protein [Geminicoccaceae bacterium]